MIDISDQEMRHMTDEELRQNKDALRRSPTRNVANNIIGRIIDEQLRRATLRGGRPSMNKTPDTLRALTFIVANGDVRESISAHVAAWEADIARREALEQALKDIRAYATNPIMEIARTGFSIIEKTANAALRGEERG